MADRHDPLVTGTMQVGTRSPWDVAVLYCHACAELSHVNI